MNLDILILPGLAVTIIGFVIYVSVVWLRDKSQRSLSMTQLDKYEEEFLRAQEANDLRR